MVGLKVELTQLKGHFDDLDFIATIDPSAPEAPWENTAVVIRNRQRNGIALIISVNLYTRHVVEIERVAEYGKEAKARREKWEEACREYDAGRSSKLPERARDVIALNGTSTLEELTAIVREHITAREELSDADV